MSITVAEVIRNGRDMHPSFDDRWTPGGPMVRALSRYQQTVMSTIADWKRDALVCTCEIDFPLVDHDDGEEIPEHHLVHGGKVVFRNANRDPEPLGLVEYRYRLQRYRFRWAAYVQGTTFHPLGRATDWTDVLRVDLDYFPRPGALTSGTSEFTMPGDPLDVLTAQAALFLARRAPSDSYPPVDLGVFAADANRAEGDYLDQVTGRRRAVVSQTQAVW